MRGVALVIAALALAGCGGDDGDRLSDAEVRRAAARACLEHNQTLLLDLDLPNTPAQEKTFQRRRLDLESGLVRRLERIDARGGRGLLRPGVDALREAIDARRGGGPDVAAQERARQAFDRLRLHGCGTRGAPAFPGGETWARKAGRLCAAMLRRIRPAVRRLRRASSREAPDALYALGEAVLSFPQEKLRLAPSDADFAYHEGEGQIYRAGNALQALAKAVCCGDRAGTRDARREVARRLLRGTAAWSLVNAPPCERLGPAVRNLRNPPR